MIDSIGLSLALGGPMPAGLLRKAHSYSASVPLSSSVADLWPGIYLLGVISYRFGSHWHFISSLPSS